MTKKSSLIKIKIVKEIILKQKHMMYNIQRERLNWPPKILSAVEEMKPKLGLIAQIKPKMPKRNRKIRKKSRYQMAKFIIKCL